MRRVALVTDAARGSSLAVIRSLGRHGWRVVAADSDPLAPGLRSRYASQRLRYPDPAHQPDAAADVILAAARRHSADLVVPVTDELILPLVTRPGGRAPDVRLALPPDAALAAAWDKVRTVEIASRIGVPVPRGAVAASREEALAVADGLGWPVVVKPRRSRQYVPGGPIESFAVRHARDPVELGAVIDGLGAGSDFLVQEYCPGTGVGVELLVHDGRVLEAFQHRRLREVPVSGGASAYRESVPLDPALVDLGRRLLAEMGWSGLAMVEFRMTPDGPRLMEVNGRIWGSLPLAVRAGVDFPAAMARLHIDGPPPDGTTPTPYSSGIRSHSLPLEAAWIGSVLLRRRRDGGLPPRAAALRAIASLVGPNEAWDSASRDDPLPALVELLRLGRLAAGRARTAVPRQAG